MSGLLIHDVDVHHGWQSKSDLYPYLGSVYRERLADYGLVAPKRGSDRGLRGFRPDALVDGRVPDGGVLAAPSVELLAEQLLDGCGVDWALLTGGPVRAVSCHPDLDYASALARAFNDFSVEHWLGADDRLRLALTVNSRDPHGASEEIARLGEHPGVVAVVLPAGSIMPLGQRFYRPIHEACADRRLVLVIQPGTEGQGVNPSPTPGGYPSYDAEFRVARTSVMQVHVTSFVFEGVFERLPGLRLLLLESGFAWVPPYLWYMDETWKDLRNQTPWVKRFPSEYVLEQVRFGARPLEATLRDTALDETLEWMQADKTLLFASDYPAWDWQNPADALSSVGPALRQRVLAGSAAELFAASS